MERLRELDEKAAEARRYEERKKEEADRSDIAHYGPRGFDPWGGGW